MLVKFNFLLLVELESVILIYLVVVLAVCEYVLVKGVRVLVVDSLVIGVFKWLLKKGGFR